MVQCFSVPAMMAVGGRSVIDRFIRFFCFVWPLSATFKIFAAQRSHAARPLARACHAHFPLVRDGALRWPPCCCSIIRFAAAKPPVNNATGHGQGFIDREEASRVSNSRKSCYVKQQRNTKQSTK